MQPEQLKKNWNLLVEGNKQGLYECFTIFYDDLYRFGLSMYKDHDLVKDSIQNLFIELWEIRDKLADVKNIKQYIFAIFKRIIYKTNKDFEIKSINLESLLEDINEEALIQDSYETILVANQDDEEKKKWLQLALDALAPRQKEIIRLRYFEKKSFVEIASITFLSERTIYNTLYNAMKLLKTCLKAHQNKL